MTGFLSASGDLGSPCSPASYKARGCCPSGSAPDQASYTTKQHRRDKQLFALSRIVGRGIRTATSKSGSLTTSAEEGWKSRHSHDEQRKRGDSHRGRAAIVPGYGLNMDGVHNQRPAESVAQVPPMVFEQGPPHEHRLSMPVHYGHLHQETGNAVLHQEPVRDLRIFGTEQQAIEDVDYRPEGDGWGCSKRSRNTNTQGSSNPVGHESATNAPADCTVGMENCVTLGGSLYPGERGCNLLFSRRGYSRLEYEAKGPASQPLQTEPGGVHSGRIHRDDSCFTEGSGVFSADVSMGHQPTGSPMGCRLGNEGLHGPQYQEGGDRPLVANVCGGCSIPTFSDFAAEQTQRGLRPDSVRNDDSVRQRHGCAGTGSKDRGSNHVPLKTTGYFYKEGPTPASYKDPTRHSILRRNGRARLPRTEAEKGSPLHSSSVRPIDVSGLRARMNAKAKARFDAVWQQAFYPNVTPEFSCSSKHRPSRLQAEHAQTLSKHNIARKVSEPGQLLNVPFTVIEEREGKLRQRFILWTYDANRLAEKQGYVAEVPLKHISAYLKAVHQECGSTRDFRCGFYGIEIPEDARKLFRYQDASGQWWELCRLPMGHSCAPELMHTVAAVVAGHPDYVRPAYAIPTSVSADIWVDNIRYAGPRVGVEEATAQLDATADRFHVTWKEAETTTCASRYEFIGVAWDHNTKKVVVSKKLRRKLSETLYSMSSGSLRAHELESLGGRLVHASAIAGVFLGAHYFAMKFLRRLSNALTRGEKEPDARVKLSSCVQDSLASWIRSVLRARKAPEVVSQTSMTVFVDASLEGWGGVLIGDQSGMMDIVGARWTKSERAHHINVLEAKALQLVSEKISHSYAGKKIVFVVDNTTVKWAARKGLSMRSEPLNDAIVRTLTRMQTLRCSVTVKWVRSADNPADLPSRVLISRLTPENLESMVQAVRNFLTCGLGLEEAS